MANILVLGVKALFTVGGQDVLVGTLVRELRARGHLVDTVELPLNMLPKESLLNQAALWRALDLRNFGGGAVDLVIATKFPSYYVRHPQKSLWLVHQHRALYELYGSRYSDISDDPRDEEFRKLLVEGDNKTIRECGYISGISKNVVERLRRYNGIEAEVLYPPPALVGRYRQGEFGDYILYVGRLCAIKRVDLMLKALPIVHSSIKFKIVGRADEPGLMDYLKNEIDKHHLWERVEFLGRVDDSELLDLYANAMAVYYAPHDEDYGYVTLEALASGKPVITANDSGGVLEFVEHEKTGLVLEPNSDAIGHGINRLVEDMDLTRRLGEQALDFTKKAELFNRGWDGVVQRLLSPLS